MSEQTSSPPSEIQSYLAAWRDSIVQVLSQLADAPFQAEVRLRRSEETGPACEGAWLRFEADKRLTGHQAFCLSLSDAARIAALLLAEPPVSGRSLTEPQRDALAEAFRQFGGAAALALKMPLGGEVEFRFAGDQPADFSAAVEAEVTLTGPQFEPTTLVVVLSPELVASLAPPPQPGPEAKPVGAAPRPDRDETPAREVNLDLLMDVELDATLRFGERPMLLRDVLELGPGAVVELDRQIDEPVELLVGGKVIARGEVVVVDGNYGLRVTEMASAQERLDSLRS